jgi:hypothetical protein
MREAIYDFETLGQTFETSPVLSLGFLEFNSDKFVSEEPYEYEELLSMCGYIKFDIAEQINHFNKIVEADTIKWWKSQGDSAKKVLKQSPSDKSIKALPKTLSDYYQNFSEIDRVWTRGNTFDPMFLRQIMRDVGKDDPFPWWTIRDTRSFIDAFLIGVKMTNKFVLKEWEEKFVAHDARHDIVVDVLRMQYVVRSVHCDD